MKFLVKYARLARGYLSLFNAMVPCLRMIARLSGDFHPNNVIHFRGNGERNLYRSNPVIAQCYVLVIYCSEAHMIPPKICCLLQHFYTFGVQISWINVR